MHGVALLGKWRADDEERVVLARDGVEVGYTTVRRFVGREQGWHEHTPTVRLPGFQNEAERRL